MAETTALGAAIAAGMADGIKVWDINRVQPTPNDVFHPLISENGKLFVFLLQLFRLAQHISSNSLVFLLVTKFQKSTYLCV